MKNILLVIGVFLSATITAKEVNENGLFLKVQLGGLITNKQTMGARFSAQLEVSNKLQLEYNAIGLGDFMPKFLEATTNNFSGIYNYGANYKLSTNKLGSRNIHYLIGAGYCRQIDMEFYNLVNLGPGFFGGTNYSFDKKETISEGIYIKPQMQCRVQQRWETSLFVYANVTGYKNVFSVGASMNLFRIKVGKGQEKDYLW
jgi:hypothetical protein